MVRPPVRSIIHELQLVDNLSVQADKLCSISPFKSNKHGKYLFWSTPSYFHFSLSQTAKTCQSAHEVILFQIKLHRSILNHITRKPRFDSDDYPIVLLCLKLVLNGL